MSHSSASEAAPQLLMICPGCSLVVLQTAELQPKQVSLCPRCGHLLDRYRQNSVQKVLALSLSGLLFYVPANFLPLLTFSVLGLKTNSSIAQACHWLFSQEQYAIAMVVLLTTMVFPLLILSCLLLLSFALSRGWQQPWMASLFRTYLHLTEWAMTDVFLVGVLVTIVKMAHMASVNLNAGFFCFIGLVMITVSAQSMVDHRQFWETLDSDPPVPLDQSGSLLLLCHDCHKLLPSEYMRQDEHHTCPRCGHALHPRKPNSLTRTWALLLTACILTFPANLLPIMEVDYFGVPDRSTIMDGILYFFEEGSYGIGLVILTASILVPLFKMIGLFIILLSIRFRWKSWLRHKSIMFRFIEFIGRWSMLDIFVITMLCSLAQFGFLSSISAAPGALYFTGVVLSTMFAALSFDPRLLWDAVEVAPNAAPRLTPIDAAPGTTTERTHGTTAHP